MIFKANKTGKVDQATVADIESTQWMRVARGFELKVALTSGLQFKFEGFKESVSLLLCISFHCKGFLTIHIIKFVKYCYVRLLKDLKTNKE